jgi:phosphohistidine phosphatase
MEIYILRHGIAEDGKPGQPDPERKLTSEGKEKLRRTLACARKAGVSPDAILSSPYTRAVETAALAQDELRVAERIVETNALTPMESAERAWNEIRMHRDASQILLAGHEPQLSNLVSYLTGSPGVAVQMKKGALARIDVASLGPEPRGVLVWLLTAKLAGG